MFERFIVKLLTQPEELNNDTVLDWWQRRLVFYNLLYLSTTFIGLILTSLFARFHPGFGILLIIYSLLPVNAVYAIASWTDVLIRTGTKDYKLKITPVFFTLLTLGLNVIVVFAIFYAVVIRNL